MDIRGYSAFLLACVSLTAQQQDRTLEKEAALGSRMVAYLRERTTAIDDSILQQYINRLGRRLAAEMPDAKLPFTFIVVADDLCPPTHEPGSLPGGYVIVPAALFTEARGEAEFAGMLAHSMEHISRRHWTRQPTPSAANIPLIFLGGESGGCADNLAIPAGFLAVQRSNELEADGLAIQAMARARFDPTALVSYLKRAQASERVAALNPVIERLPAWDYEVTTGEFADMQKRILRFTKRPQSTAAPTLRRN